MEKPLIIDTGFGIAIRLNGKESCPLLFEYDGKIYATNLFKMHDTHGFPLSNSLVECKKYDWYPCVEQFVLDAVRAGWPKERAERVLREAIADSN